MNDKLLSNLDKLHTTELGAERVQANLAVRIENVVEWCRELILSENAEHVRKGKNWYVICGDIVITITATSMTVITAHRKQA